MTAKTSKQTSNERLSENIDSPELSDKAPDSEEITDEQIAETEKGLFDAIAKRVNPNGLLVSRERFALLEKMEDYAQDLAELVVRYFKGKDLEARKDLILKSVEVLKLNPPAGPGHNVNLHGPSFLNR